MRKFILLAAIVILLAACAPTAAQIQPLVAQTLTAFPTATAYPTLTSNPTYTPFPTLTAYPTQTAYPTHTPAATYTPWIVTVTFTATPQFTSTITLTPTKTETLTPTLDPLKADKEDGFYLVGVDIAPGVWRSQSGFDKCYWEVSTQTGDIISNDFGMSGGTMYVPASGYQVELKNCGTWTYLSK
jgi:hypothetical protein